MKSFLIIGMGSLGHHLVTELDKQSCEIMATDINEAKLDGLKATFKNVVSTPVCDCTNRAVLEGLGVEDFDVCVVLCKCRATPIARGVERGYVDRKYGKHRHADDGQHHAYNLAYGRHGEYLCAHRSHIHACPPQRVAKAMHGAIDGCFILVEEQCRKVGTHHYRGYICPQKACGTPHNEPAQSDV